MNSPRAQLNVFRLMVFSNVTKSQPLHRNLKVADSDVGAKESLSIGKWLEDFIAFTAVIAQTLNAQSFGRR